jgi:ParB family transcriptional regulator, chromosome partitioning protein
MSAERVFAGTYITEVEVRDRALAWVPEVMRFAGAAPVEAERLEPELTEPAEDAVAADGANDDDQTPRELAA